MAEFSLTGTAFADEGTIPRRHTGDGEDRSPPLSWSAPPAGTSSLALILDDPDAPGGRFIHWLAWGIPRTLMGLARGRQHRRRDATTSARSATAARPAPRARTAPLPLRAPRRNRDLGLAPGAGVQELERAVAAKVLAVAELVGSYQR
jgi:phosphatidylethanolamine-binding protein (PEBP) family uncharacterized protein